MLLTIDLDSIVADFMSLHLQHHADSTGEVLAVEDITDWDMRNCTQFPDKIFEPFMKPGFFTALAPVPGALESLQLLHDEGHRIRIASHAVTPHAVSEKLEWCKQHLHFIDQKSVWIGGNKHDIAGDCLVDDGPHNADAFRREHPGALILTIAYPYNAQCQSYDARCGSHLDYAGAWREIVEHIRRRQAGIESYAARQKAQSP